MTDRNTYMAKYMRAYRARQTAERDKLRAQTQTGEALLTQILDVVIALSERVSRIEEILKSNVSRLTQANVNTPVNVKDSKLTEANVNDSQPTPLALAREARRLHDDGLSYEQIAKRWTEEGIPTLKGGRWHKGTIGKLVQRHL